MKLLCLFFSLLLSINVYSQEAIKIESVENKIILGPLANNRDLAFGVKSILEEVIQDEGFNLDETSTRGIKVELLYFDVLKTNVQLGGFNKNTNTTVIAAKAYLIENGKVIKEVEAKGQAKDISTATLIIDKGGKFSQAGVSTSLKKVCEQLIDNLLL
jgi:uncharacterized lipoprotein YajG